jgi:hypothetical protein
MSVRLDGSGDRLSVAASLGLSTGAFSVGLWIKQITDRNQSVNFFVAGDTVPDAADFIGLATDTDGTTMRGFSTGGNSGPYASSIDTWYYAVVSRDGGGGFLKRIFDDSTSTTPVDQDGYTDSGDYSALDTFVIGEMFSGEGPIAEIACVRAHIGVAWSDAQCRTESQKLTPQTGGGSIYGNWKLETTTADADGINDSGGGAHHLTNTGCVNGASRPSQLEAAGGGPLTLTPTGSETTTESGTATVVYGPGIIYKIRW